MAFPRGAKEGGLCPSGGHVAVRIFFTSTAPPPQHRPRRTIRSNKGTPVGPTTGKAASRTGTHALLRLLILEDTQFRSLPKVLFLLPVTRAHHQADPGPASATAVGSGRAGPSHGPVVPEQASRMGPPKPAHAHLLPWVRCMIPCACVCACATKERDRVRKKRQERERGGGPGARPGRAHTLHPLSRPHSPFSFLTCMNAGTFVPRGRRPMPSVISTTDGSHTQPLVANARAASQQGVVAG